MNVYLCEIYNFLKPQDMVKKIAKVMVKKLKKDIQVERNMEVKRDMEVNNRFNFRSI